MYKIFCFSKVREVRMIYTLEDLQKLTNEALFSLMLKTGIKKIKQFPVNWTEAERNCIIVRLTHYYKAMQLSSAELEAVEVKSDPFEGILEAIKAKSPNDALLRKNIQYWTTKDVEYAKTFL